MLALSLAKLLRLQEAAWALFSKASFFESCRSVRHLTIDLKDTGHFLWWITMDKDDYQTKNASASSVFSRHDKIYERCNLHEQK